MPKGDFGFNGKISNRGAGSRRIRVVALDFGLGIIASSDSEARNRRAFYPIVTTGSSYTMTLAFVSWEEREAFNTWITKFMYRLANGTAKYGTMTVQVPSRNFIRVAVPESEIEFGEGLGDLGYTMAIGFIGASNPIDINLAQRAAGISFFKGPKVNRESRYFYPSGRQISGAESLDGAIFDNSATGGTYTPTTPAEDREPTPFGPRFD